MNMGKLLKNSANLFMSITMLKVVAKDLGTEFRRDAAAVGARSDALVRRSPYGSVGAAAVLGIAAGMVFGLRQRHRQAR